MKAKTIQVNADEYRRFMRERAAASALSRRADKRKEGFDLPTACKSNVGEYVVVDGNGQAIGKFTIAPRSGFTVADSFTGRIS